MGSRKAPKSCEGCGNRRQDWKATYCALTCKNLTKYREIDKCVNFKKKGLTDNQASGTVNG